MKMKKTDFLAATAVIAVIIIPSIAFGAEERETPTAAGCVEKTGMSEAECTEMIKKMKDMPQRERGGNNLGKPIKNGEKKGMINMENFRGGSHPQDMKRGMDGNIDSRIENAQEMREKKEKRFARTEERIEKLIEYIESEGVDVEELEADLAEFKEKAAEILSVFDTYIQALEDYKNESSDDNAAKIKESRETVRTLSGKLATFYQTEVREHIKTLIDEVEDNE